MRTLVGVPFAALWLCTLAELPSAQRLAWLSADELARAATYAFERDRRRFLAARCALRECLSARTGVAPGSLQIVAGPFEKPYLANPPDCHFNLSRREEWALVAIGDAGEIGVDIEMHHVVDGVVALARAHFSASEFGEFLTLASSARDLAFLRVWTRKEACLKAVGTGLSIEPASLDVGLGEGVVELSIGLPAGPARVEVRSIDSGRGSVAAVARVL